MKLKIVEKKYHGKESAGHRYFYRLTDCDQNKPFYAGDLIKYAHATDEAMGNEFGMKALDEMVLRSAEKDYEKIYNRGFVYNED